MLSLFQMVVSPMVVFPLLTPSCLFLRLFSCFKRFLSEFRPFKYEDCLFSKMVSKTGKLKPPFEATDETINCPLENVREFNPVRVDLYCHSNTRTTVLCTEASNCKPYLELLNTLRVQAEKELNPRIMGELGF